MKGSYILLVELANSKDILVGKLGYISFPKAFYAYVGSAMNGFKARLARHLKDNKKPHWHIDYLLKQAKLSEIILCPSEPFASCHSEGEKRPRNLLFSSFLSSGLRASAHQDKLREESHSAKGRLRVECFLAQALAREFHFIPGFGASDCKCKSHLYFGNKKDKLISKVIEAVDQAGLAYKIFPPKEGENGTGV